MCVGDPVAAGSTVCEGCMSGVIIFAFISFFFCFYF